MGSKYLLWVLNALMIVLTTTGCKERADAPLYSHFEVIEDAKWGMDDEFFFSIPVDDVDTEYSLTGVLRIGPSCRLKTIPIGIVEENARGSIDTSTVMCPLESISPHSSGYNIREYDFPVSKPRKFKESGVYTISFRHLLQDSIASGIVEVGLIVKPRE